MSVGNILSLVSCPRKGVGGRTEKAGVSGVRSLYELYTVTLYLIMNMNTDMQSRIVIPAGVTLWETDWGQVEVSTSVYGKDPVAASCVFIQ